MRWREWLGVGERRWKKASDEEVQPAKTLWDWLQLLIVPAILIGVTFAWSATQTRSDNKREDRRIAADRTTAREARQDATLQTYLDQMSGLMLRQKLLTSKDGSPVRAVARTVTLTALRRLDSSRNREVVRFLRGAGLLAGDFGTSRARPVSLESAHLEDVHLAGAHLNNLNLDGAVLSDADLTFAFLGGADLREADLRGADFAGAHLEEADLTGAALWDADLTGADLPGADLKGADLTDADLTGADLTDADLKGAILKGAILKSAILKSAILKGAKGLPKRHR